MADSRERRPGSVTSSTRTGLAGTRSVVTSPGRRSGPLPRSHSSSSTGSSAAPAAAWARTGSPASARSTSSRSSPAVW